MEEMSKDKAPQLSTEAIAILQHLKELPQGDKTQSAFSLRLLFVLPEFCVKAQQELQNLGFVELEERNAYFGIRSQRLTPLGKEHLAKIPPDRVISDNMFSRNCVSVAISELDEMPTNSYPKYYHDSVK